MERDREKTAKLQCWDTSGQERFRSITSTYYRGAHVILVVYDITDIESFNDIQHFWMNEINRYASSTTRKILVGTKVDLVEHRQVDTSVAQEMAHHYGFDGFYETSAKDTINIAEVFQAAADTCHQLVMKHVVPRPNTIKPTIKPDVLRITESRSCCLK